MRPHSSPLAATPTPLVITTVSSWLLVALVPDAIRELSSVTGSSVLSPGLWRGVPRELGLLLAPPH